MNDLTLPTTSLVDALRREASGAPESGIVEVANYGRGREAVIPLWVGEGDISTPSFISEAATRALAAGETFYTWQRGIPDLRAGARDAITRRLYGRPFDAEEFYVTGSGMQAIQIALGDGGRRRRRDGDPDADLAERGGGDGHHRRASRRSADDVRQ